ncbi:MAG TPA: NUDIX domain-containing protein [Candidatus Nitrosotenuis sp.]|nr:NUDIX domain-containing protein [Candidatus Nitrosotenuis sp.]
MIKPHLIDSFVADGKTIRVEWFDVARIEDLPSVEWQQVYAIGSLDGRVPVVIYADENANLPGGKTEQGENIEETIRRELIEEINCRILSWHPIGYQKLAEPGVIESIYQLRVYAKLEKIGDFVSDPGGTVIGYKLVNFNDLNNEINYGKVGERIMELVAAKFA